jgi:hypothetical protein
VGSLPYVHVLRPVLEFPGFSLAGILVASPGDIHPFAGLCRSALASSQGLMTGDDRIGGEEARGELAETMEIWSIGVV